MVGSVDDEGGYTEETIYLGQGTGANTTNLEIGIVVEVDPIGMSLGELGESDCFLEFVTELVSNVLMFLVEEVEAFSSPRVGGGGVVVVSDGAAYDGRLFLRLSIIETGLLMKVLEGELGGSLFQTIVFCGGGVCSGSFFRNWNGMESLT